MTCTDWSRGNIAIGFPCPMCQEIEAEVEELKLPQVVLVCAACSWRWAVEP